MGLFSPSQMEQINAIAAKSKETLKPISSSKSITSVQRELEESTRTVLEYFKDSPAILITSVDQLHDYVTKVIESGYCGVDTETTGTDKVNDTVVGFSLYYPGGAECYVPCKHLVPIFNTPYTNQLTYEDARPELQRLVDAKVKTIWYNADFDIPMIYRCFNVDFLPAFYYDGMVAWRCLKENETARGLKEVYNKYVLGGKGNPKKFSDFFSHALFPYSKPEVAALYAANDAKLHYELFIWQLPYVTKDHPKCKKHHLERVADLVWNIEFPLVRICALMHRIGVYLDLDTSNVLQPRYHAIRDAEFAKLVEMIKPEMDKADSSVIYKSPFKTPQEFKPNSPNQVEYLLNTIMQLGLESTKSEYLENVNLPITNQLSTVRSLDTLISGFIDKPPKMAASDGRIHATFDSCGAKTGRFSSKAPNMQNIPSHAIDIRHQFRATPAMEKLTDCKFVDGKLQVTLGSYDSVLVQNGSMKDVIDLCESDILKLDSDELSIAEIQHNLPNTVIIFNVIDSDRTYRILHYTPPYVMMSSDYSQQEPKVTAYLSGDPNMLAAFQEGKDIYSTIAALGFNKSYRDCLEHQTNEDGTYVLDENGEKITYPEGKERRTQAKSIVLGIVYGRTTMTIGEQLFGKNKEMSPEDRTKAAQGVYDAVLGAFPDLQAFITESENLAQKYGYVETILGRRRHIPDMQLKPYEFKAGVGYINPDIDPLDPNTLNNTSELPDRVVKQLEKELASYKHKGQRYKRIKQLNEVDHIKVIDNTNRIAKARRKCCNSRVQGSAAELTKIAMLKVFNNPEWSALGGRVHLQVHDELIAEIPMRNAKRGAEILSNLMSEAGSFLPFTISCDVTTTLRWYGLAYPCSYTKPTDISDVTQLSVSEICWIQYHLFELEYPLPVHKKPGVKLQGDAALGVDGEWSEDMDKFILDYINRYHISKDEFLDHIENKVLYDLQKLN